MVRVPGAWLATLAKVAQWRCAVPTRYLRKEPQSARPALQILLQLNGTPVALRFGADAAVV